jgi:FkbM family methyltransferase
MPTKDAVKRPERFLGSDELAALLGHLAPLGCLDIGARGGVVADIEPLGPAASVYGFEPDEDECAKLNRSIETEPHPFGALQFLPVALGPVEEQRTLNIMRHEGASSLLPPDPEVTKRFSTRSAYFDVARTVTIDTLPLDRVVTDYRIANPVYMKIDVEGFELEILKGAEALLQSSLLAMRAEIAFLPCRIGQPDFGEIAAYLKRFGMMPMGFLYIIDWRSTTGVKHPRKVGGPIPYSRGQMVHGDVLFLRDPLSLGEDSEADIKAKLSLAMLALLYEYVDFAHDIVTTPRISAYLQDVIGTDGLGGLGQASRFLARRHDCLATKEWGRNLFKRAAFEVKHVFA